MLDSQNYPLLSLTYPNLVGGLEHFLLFHILGISSSQLPFRFFRGVGQPPTSNGYPITMVLQ